MLVVVGVVLHVAKSIQGVGGGSATFHYTGI